MDTPPVITPHDLVDPRVLRIARVAYDATPRAELLTPRAQHRARLATAVTAAAPFIVADYLMPLVYYLDLCFSPLYDAAHREAQRAGHTPLFYQHRGGYRAYQHAATLLEHRAYVLDGRSWARRVDELYFPHLAQADLAGNAGHPPR